MQKATFQIGFTRSRKLLVELRFARLSRMMERAPRK